MSRANRRKFLQTAAGATAALLLSRTKASARVLGANDRIRIAVAGVGGRGQSHLQEYAKRKDVELVYLVDPDSRIYEQRKKAVHDIAGYEPQCLPDLRKALEDKDLDAVSIASPNHWHSLLAIWSCQAGKDVYVEKPCSHNIFEGRKLVEAARKYQRIVQHGTQSRSCADWMQTVSAVRSGKYGKLLISYGYASKPRGSIGIHDPTEPPHGFDFDLWLGPAPQQSYSKAFIPYNWHWFWDFGNGEIGNQGVHQLDIARWAMPEGATPKRVLSFGGRFGYQDQGQTPNTQLTIIDFGDAKLFFEDRGLVTGKTMKVTNEFYTDQGVIKDGKFFPNGKSEGEPLDAVPVGFPDTTSKHFGNFLECVRSRKQEDLAAEVLEGHLSSMLAHLGNTSYRLGETVPFNKETKAFGDDKAAYEAFEGMKQHLADAAKLDLNTGEYRLGRSLTFDATTERYVGDEEANQYVARPYRAPYLVPEQV